MQTKQNTEEVKKLVALVREKMHSSPEEALEYLAECDQIIESMPDNAAKGMLIALVYQYYLHLDHLGEAERGYNMGLELSEKMGELRDVAILNSNLGLIYSRKGNLNRSLDHFMNALDYFEQHDDKMMQAQLYNNIGVLYSNKLEFDRALDFMMKAMNIREEIDDQVNLCDTAINIGNLYTRIGKPEMAIEYFRYALDYCPEDDVNRVCSIYSNLCQTNMMVAKSQEALDYGLKALDLYDRIGDAKPQASLMNNLGNLYYNLRDFIHAKEFYQRAIDQYSQKNEPWGTANALTSMANSEIRLLQYDLALTHLLQARTIAEEIDAIDILYLNHQNSFLLYMSLADSEKENHLKRSGYLKKALDEQSALLALRERISSEEKTRALAEMELKYDSEKKSKEAEIYRLKNVELAEAYEKLKSAQDEIIQLERSNSVSAMAVTANHQINQPLTVLQGNLDLLEIQLAGNHDAMKFLERARQAAQKIRDIVVSYKDIESYRFEKYSEKTQMVVIDKKKDPADCE